MTAQQPRFRDVWRQQYDIARREPAAVAPKGARGVASIVAGIAVALTVVAFKAWPLPIAACLAVIAAVSVVVTLVLEIKCYREWNRRPPQR